MNIREIMSSLPHRYPFLLLDRVLELNEQYIVAQKNVTIDEPFFRGISRICPFCQVSYRWR